jgi:hypothetical protein
VTRNVLGIGIAAIAALVLLVAVGRWEQHHAARTEMDGMRSVLAAIGGDIASSRLSGYRYGPPDCLAYHDNTMLLALQLCFDADGRLVQSVDRRAEQPRYSSLEYEPSLSTIRFPRARIDRLLQLAGSASG